MSLLPAKVLAAFRRESVDDAGGGDCGDCGSEDCAGGAGEGMGR